MITHDARLDRADASCNARGSRLTPLRREVLSLLLEMDRPVGAYVLLEMMARNGRRPLPPTIYRALDFLVRQGLVHKVYSANSFVACSQAGGEHTAELFVCRRCGDAREVACETSRAILNEGGGPQEFHVEGMVVEVLGLCGACQDAR